MRNNRKGCCQSSQAADDQVVATDITDGDATVTACIDFNITEGSIAADGDIGSGGGGAGAADGNADAGFIRVVGLYDQRIRTCSGGEKRTLTVQDAPAATVPQL